VVTRTDLVEYMQAHKWQLMNEPGRMGFILFYAHPDTGYYMVQDVQPELWLVRTQEKVLRDSGILDTFVARFVALPHDPSYSGIYTVHDEALENQDEKT
jgi:hypothetical protein